MKTKVKDIQSAIQRKKAKWRAGENKLTRLPTEQLKRYLGAKVPPVGPPHDEDEP